MFIETQSLELDAITLGLFSAYTYLVIIHSKSLTLIYKSENRSPFFYCFYSVIVFLYITRSLIYGLGFIFLTLAQQPYSLSILVSKDQFQRLLLTSLGLPKALYSPAFILLLLDSLDSSNYLCNVSAPSSSLLTRKHFFKSSVYFLLISLFVGIIITNLGYISYYLDSSLYLYSSVAECALCIILYLAMQLSKSMSSKKSPGYPEQAKLSLTYQSQVLIFWVFGKLFFSTCVLFLASINLYLNPGVSIEMACTTNQDFAILFMVGYVAELVISEIISGFFVLEESFIKNLDLSFEAAKFKGDESSGDLLGISLNNTNGLNDLTRTFVGHNESSLDLLGSNQTPARLTAGGSAGSGGSGGALKGVLVDVGDVDFSKIRLRDVVLGRDGVFERKEGLGAVYRGRYKGMIIKLRQLALSDLSSFVKKSVDTELKSWEERQSFLPVERYIGFFKEGASKFLLVSEASPMEYVSLTEYIRVKGKRNESGIPLKAKIKTLKNLSQAMHQVVQLWDNVSHGHLCPNNILIDPETLELKIADFGFSSLKKYCSMLTGYCNKDQYTAPEHLAKPGKVVSGSTQASDVYSFGMISWHLMMEEIPFKGLDLKQLKKIIVTEKIRPKILRRFEDGLGQVVKLCWQPEAANRPSFKQVHARLKSLS